MQHLQDKVEYTRMAGKGELLLQLYRHDNKYGSRKMELDIY